MSKVTIQKPNKNEIEHCQENYNHAKNMYDLQLKDEDLLYGEEDFLFNADPNCVHDIKTLWDGVKCKKCPGWFCY